MSFCYLQFFQKTNENNSTWGTIEVMLIFFCYFFGIIEKDISKLTDFHCAAAGVVVTEWLSRQRKVGPLLTQFLLRPILLIQFCVTWRVSRGIRISWVNYLAPLCSRRRCSCWMVVKAMYVDKLFMYAWMFHDCS